ncbi:cytochrome d ubiquinol oxidase subunit II [candidate division KSB1 bacterium]
MNELFEHHLLQQYWWILASILAALLVFLLFVQGGQSLFTFISKDENEKTMMVNALGRKWELTFTTLVTFGGAMFASFPLFYSTSFGGAYWVWMAILFCFIIQAISYEYRRKKGNVYGQKTYDTFLFINGSIGVILLGTAVGTFYTGSNFIITEYNQSVWQVSSRGLEAALNINNLTLGLAIFFLARILGAQYFINSINNENIRHRSKRQVTINTVFFLLFFLYFVVQLFLREGFAYNPETKEVFMEKFKYFNNLIEMPIILVFFLTGVLLVLGGIAITIIKSSKKGIWYSGIGTILTVFSLFIIAGLNNTSFYPSSFDPQSSLTIENASSSLYTLKTMSFVSLLIPFVLAYIIWAWRAIDKKKIDTDELNTEDLKY